MRLDLQGAHREACALIADLEHFVSAVLSGRLSNTAPSSPRVDLRVVLIRGVRSLQILSSSNQTSTTTNVAEADVAVAVKSLLEQGYANITIRTTSQTWQCRITRKREALIHIERGDHVQNLEHDHVKARMLEESDPFLIAVGISTADGKVKPSKRDKFRQVDDFLRVFQSTLDKEVDAGRMAVPTAERPLRVVDLGCGHAYLTFAVQAWATRVRGWPIDVTGVDRRDSSVDRNNRLVKDLAIESTTFTAGDIEDAAWSGSPPDVVLALHACDTATDDALAWAVGHEARVVLAAPCCHHSLQSQVSEAPHPWDVVTRHGILRERLLDVVTDAMRAAILRTRGYRTDVFEFVGGEHTPRNIMLRAVRTGVVDASAKDEVAELAEAWGVTPVLGEKLGHA